MNDIIDLSQYENRIIDLSKNKITIDFSSHLDKFDIFRKKISNMNYALISDGEFWIFESAKVVSCVRKIKTITLKYKTYRKPTLYETRKLKIENVTN